MRPGGSAPVKEISVMTERNMLPGARRLAQLAGALALGSALAYAPLAFAEDAATPAPAAAAPAAAAPAAQAAAPAAPKPGDVVAKVGDETITEADLGYAAEDLGQELQNVPPQDQKAFLTTVLIDMKIMAKAARDQKLDQTEDYKGRLAYLEDRSLRRAYFDQQIAGALTPEAVKAAYDQYAKAFQPQDEVHARHILVKTEAEAKDIKAQLDKGAKFEDLAKAKSTDTGSAANGGDLGFFGKGQMVKPFEDAAFALQPGQVSEPVQSQFGWHIIKVEEKRKTQPAPIDQVAQQLQQQILFKKFDDTVNQLKQGVKIDIPDPTLAAAVKAQSEQAPAAE
jgi:peptidyl-prolyl cis-trans isomerase C